MRGSIKTVLDGVHRLRIDVGVDPFSGKRRQRMVTFHGDKRAAEKKLRELLKTLDDGAYVEPTKVTLGMWLAEWVESSVKPRVRARATPATKAWHREHDQQGPDSGDPTSKTAPLASGVLLRGSEGLPIDTNSAPRDPSSRVA